MDPVEIKQDGRWKVLKILDFMRGDESTLADVREAQTKFESVFQSARNNSLFLDATMNRLGTILPTENGYLNNPNNLAAHCLKLDNNPLKELSLTKKQLRKMNDVVTKEDANIDKLSVLVMETVGLVYTVVWLQKHPGIDMLDRFFVGTEEYLKHMQIFWKSNNSKNIEAVANTLRTELTKRCAIASIVMAAASWSKENLEKLTPDKKGVDRVGLALWHWNQYLEQKHDKDVEPWRRQLLIVSIFICFASHLVIREGFMENWRSSIKPDPFLFGGQGEDKSLYELVGECTWDHVNQRIEKGKKGLFWRTHLNDFRAMRDLKKATLNMIDPASEIYTAIQNIK